MEPSEIIDYPISKDTARLLEKENNWPAGSLDCRVDWRERSQDSYREIIDRQTKEAIKSSAEMSECYSDQYWIKELYQRVVQTESQVKSLSIENAFLHNRLVAEAIKSGQNPDRINATIPGDTTKKIHRSKVTRKKEVFV